MKLKWYKSEALNSTIPSSNIAIYIVAFNLMIFIATILNVTFGLFVAFGTYMIPPYITIGILMSLYNF